MKKEFAMSSVEAEPKLASVEIDLARHSIKGAEIEGRVPISEEGILASIEAGTGEHTEDVTKRAKKGEAVEVYGSLLERTQQSALFRMLSDHFKKSGFKDVDPEDVMRWLEQGGGVKKVETPLLGFQLGDGEYKKEMLENLNKGRYLAWLVERSDEAAIENKQDPDKVTPHSIQAGNVASFIWALGSIKAEKLIKQGDGETVDFAFAATHGGVLESFLYKVIEIKEGEVESQKFIDDLSKVGYFEENQGFKAKYNAYSEDGQKWDIEIEYNGKSYTLSQNEAVKIIQEGIDLKSKLKKE